MCFPHYDDCADFVTVQAGLFSAVLTAFIIDVYAELKVDHSEYSSHLLRQILRQQQGKDIDQSVMDEPQAQPSTTVVVVLSLWFASLALSLASALFSIFMKQWFHVYEKWMSASQEGFQQAIILRLFYKGGFETWRVPEIFAALGVLLQFALILFVIGLVTYLWTLNFIIFSIMSFLVFVMFALSGLVIILPVCYDDCPYKIPVAYFLVKLRTRSPANNWTERDVSVTRAHTSIDDEKSGQAGAVEQAIVLTASILDTGLDNLHGALAEITADSKTDTTFGLTRDRVRDLVPECALLLSDIATSEALLKQLHLNPPNPQLLALWKLVYGEARDLHPSITYVLQYLERCIEGHEERKGNLGLEAAVTFLVRDIMPLYSTLQCCE